MTPSPVAIALFYGLYFAVLGIVLPFMPPYFASWGLSAIGVGSVIAAFQVAKSFGALIGGGAADRWGRTPVLAFTLVGAPLATLLLLTDLPQIWGWGILGFSLWVTLFGLMRAAPLPLVETIAMTGVREQGWHYGRLRLWGSVGFIVAVLVAGVAVDRFGPRAFPWVILPFLMGLVLLIPRLREATPATSPSQKPAPWPIREAAPLVAAGFFMQASHGAYYGFFSLAMAQRGYSATLIGLFWAIGVLAEVGLLNYADQLVRRFSAARLLLWALLLAVLRWTGLAMFDAIVVILMLQTLHAATFAIFHVAAVNLAKERAPEGTESRFQSLYSAGSFGLGGGVGMFSAGFIVDGAGYAPAFGVSAAMALAGWWVARRWL
ncbi:MAG: hypothetical protein AUJ55_02720 [Proteobacteria bacterium CG1_02_64_396]|nr:MAG: hypothetical protein AUJ55_02720 [Proteobacteria bacterium CG1_02_64_396]